MSDTCTCLSGWDDGDPAQFYCATQRKARKPHVCCECRKPIQSGEIYENVRAKWDEKRISVLSTCGLCLEIRDRFECGGGFTHQTLWEDLREVVYPTLSMCCLNPLSIEAQRKVAEDYSNYMPALRDEDDIA